MKNIFKFVYLLIALFAISSCEDGTENSMYEGEPTSFFLDKFAVAKGPGVGYKDFDIKIGTMSPLSSPAEFSITRISGDAVLGTDYEILNGGKVQIAAGSNLGIIKLRVYGANLSQTVAKTLVFDLISPSVRKADYNTTISLSLIFGCDSALEGTYQYSTVNAFAPGLPDVPGPLTGTVVFSKVGDGLYQISDSSFGAFAQFSGYQPTSTGVRIEDLCGKLTFKTANQYGDTFVISNIVVAGNKLTFKWTTSYGEYGTTTLTKSNGNWPALY